MAATTRNILNYRQVSDRLITGGQPSEDQIKAAAQEGYTTVINLATINPRYSLPDEAGLVRSLGLAYHHIPVAWEGPTPDDFAAFETVMNEVGDAKTLIHCAANYRVTAFYGLYAQKRLGWTEVEAEALRARVWEGDYPVWEAFIRRKRAELAGE